MDEAARVIRRLTEQGKTLATAESCTGGLAAMLLTEEAGASTYFPGGVVSYSPDVKENVLGVRPETVESHGVVSLECAAEMAEGVRMKTHSDYALSITGVAGPDPDERGVAVGIVYIGLATPDGTFCRPLDLGKRRRDRIQDLSSNHALDVVRRYLTGLPITLS